MTRTAVGQTVRVVDYFRAMRTCLNRDLGDGVLYGAGGCVLRAGTLEEPATIAALGSRGSARVLIAWDHERSMWIDVDNLALDRTTKRG